MNRIVSLIIGCMLCFVSVAQDKSVNEPQGESNKIIQVEFRSAPRNGDTIHVNMGCHIFGNFFKRVSENVIKIPSTTYQDRFLRYDGGEILHCTIKQGGAFSGYVCLKDLDLLVKPTDKRVTLTVTSKTNELLEEITVIISPEISLYMKINKELVAIDSSLPIPTFKEDDVVGIVAITDEGEVLKTVECYVTRLDRPMCERVEKTNGGEFAMDDKRSILNPGRGIYVGGNFVDKDGVSWSKCVLWENKE